MLVIEDELVVRRLIAEALQHSGCIIRSARDEEEAVEVMEGHSGLIDLLLTANTNQELTLVAGLVPITGGQLAD